MGGVRAKSEDGHRASEDDSATASKTSAAEKQTPAQGWSTGKTNGKNIFPRLFHFMPFTKKSWWACLQDSSGLFERERISPICWFAPQMPMAELDQAKNPGAWNSTWLSHRMVGTRALGPPTSASLHALAGSGT